MITARVFFKDGTNRDIKETSFIGKVKEHNTTLGWIGQSLDCLWSEIEEIKLVVNGEVVEETREENLNENSIVEASAVYNEEMTLSAEEIEGLYGVYYLTILKNGTWESLGYYEESFQVPINTFCTPACDLQPTE